jgi:hypothetical protein
MAAYSVKVEDVLDAPEHELALEQRRHRLLPAGIDLLLSLTD